MGSKMSAAMGKTLMAGAAATGAAVSTAIGTALYKGFGRLTAIDNAEGKLEGLGHTTLSTAKIMDSALASVKAHPSVSVKLQRFQRRPSPPESSPART